MENYTEEDLKKWVRVRENKEYIVGEICGGCEVADTKYAILMAGSPGAGKTETAHRLLEVLGSPCVHIDQDRIKSLLPGYDGGNAPKYQTPASHCVSFVLDYVFKQGLNFLNDSTMSNLEIAKRNIDRSLNRGYQVKIYFVYQNLENAWYFVQKRQEVEGRVVPKDAFVRQFVNSRVVVNEVKKCYGKDVELNFVKKVIDSNGIVMEDLELRIDSLDEYIGIVYDDEQKIFDLIGK